MHFEKHKIIFFAENLKKIYVSPVNLGRSSLIWVHSVCNKGYLSIYRKHVREQRTLAVNGQENNASENVVC